jgi:hypothetical protein
VAGAHKLKRAAGADVACLLYVIGDHGGDPPTLDSRTGTRCLGRADNAQALCRRDAARRLSSPGSAPGRPLACTSVRQATWAASSESRAKPRRVNAWPDHWCWSPWRPRPPWRPGPIWIAQAPRPSGANMGQTQPPPRHTTARVAASLGRRDPGRCARARWRPALSTRARREREPLSGGCRRSGTSARWASRLPCPAGRRGSS